MGAGMQAASHEFVGQRCIRLGSLETVMLGGVVLRARVFVGVCARVSYMRL